MTDTTITQSAAPTREQLVDLIASHLTATYHCTRVWEAWNVGTMTQDDFEPAAEGELPDELADAILAALSATPQAPADPTQKYVEDFASRYEWKKGQAEGAFEFVQRISYRQGWDDARNRDGRASCCEKAPSVQASQAVPSDALRDAWENYKDAVRDYNGLRAYTGEVPHGAGVEFQEARSALMLALEVFFSSPAAQPVAQAPRQTGYIAPRGRYVPPVLFSPYTGEPRDARDIQSDPQGVLIVPPGALLFAAQPVAQAPADFNAGIESAARWVEQRREDFDREHGHTDPETGAFEYGTGPRAQAKEDYSSELYDIVEGIRALAAQTRAEPTS